MALERQLRVLDARGVVDLQVAPRPAIKIAFASDDLKHVNQHFGSAQRFAIYSVDAAATVLLEVAEFGASRAKKEPLTPPPGGGCPTGPAAGENKLLEKFVVLDGCAAVYCQAVGGAAIRQLMQLGVQAIKVPEGSAIGPLLHALQVELQRGPTGWLARAAGRNRKSEDRFDLMEEEGWSE